MLFKVETYLPPTHDVQVVAVPEQVRQFALQGWHIDAERKYPGAHAVQVATVVVHVEQLLLQM